MPKSQSLIENIETGMMNLKPTQRNEVDSIKEAMIPLEANAFEFIASSQIDTKISNAYSVILTDALDSGDINIKTWQINNDSEKEEINVSFSTSSIWAKTAVSYSLEGSARRDIKETLGGFIGGVMRKMRGLNKDNQAYDEGF